MKEPKNKQAKSKRGFPRNRRANKKYIKAVENSTMGYWKEIALEQWRHFPPKTKKLMIGMLSNQRMDCLQWGQNEDGVTTCPPLFQRNRQTFRKLPTQAPNKPNKKGVIRAWI